MFASTTAIGSINRVAPEDIKPFGKLIGLGTVLCGVGIAVYAPLAYFADKKLAEYVAGVIYSDICMTCVEDKPVKVMEINDESIERLIDKYGGKK